MMPRSQLAALAVLLVGLGVVLILVGDTGVSTGVFVAGQFTETPSPTAGPSPTPLPDASAENWIETAPGQYTYTDTSITANIQFQTAQLDELAASLGVEPPAENDPYPLVSMLSQVRTDLESVVSDMQLSLEPEAVTGPAIEFVDNSPVNIMRMRIEPQTPEGTGEAFPGLDLAQILIEHADEQVTFVQYLQRGEPNPVVYADFRAWLRANLADITGADMNAAPEATEEGAAESTEDTAEPPLSEIEETAEPPAAEATDPMPEAEATTSAEAIATPTETWMELAPGQLLYTANPNAFIQYTAAPLADFAQSVGVEIEDDQAPSADDILNAVRARLETQLEQETLTLEEDAFEGPLTEDISGVPFHYLRLTIPPQTGPDGQQQPGQDVVMGIIETGDDQVTAVQFVYQGDADPAIYADFRDWLAENIVRLSELDAPEAAAPPAAEPTTAAD